MEEHTQMSIQAKARRLFSDGKVAITQIDPDKGIVKGSVQGDHGAYKTEVTTQGTFSCTCRWGDHNSHGSRLCSHADALRLAAGCWLGF